MPDPSPAKERALRVSLAVASTDPAARWRNRLTVIAVCVCLGWLAVSLLAGNGGSQQYSPGPLSNAHAQLGCEKCHAARSPMRNDVFLYGWNQAGEDDAKMWHRPSDTLCQSCHPVAGANGQLLTSAIGSAIARTIAVGTHSDHQRVSTVDSCASCHAEHRGFDHSPSKIANVTCYECHRDLDGFRQGVGNGIATTITSFESGHPEFRSLRSDGGTLKFNHALHMTGGLVRAGGQHKLTRTLASYPGHEGVLSGYTDTEGRIQLQCNFCHQPVGGTSDKSELMSMPSYMQSCQVCHSTDLESAGGSGFAKTLNVEHGASGDTIEADLRVYFALKSIASNDLKSKLPTAVRPPDADPTRLWNNAAGSTDTPQALQRFLNQALARVRTNCVFCHLTADNDTGRGVPRVRDVRGTASPANAELETYETTWFKLARFDHAAHRNIGCIDCHPLTGGKGDLQALGQSLSSDRPMIKGMASCVECHQSGHVSAPKRRGPTDCTSCHWYHRPVPDGYLSPQKQK